MGCGILVYDGYTGTQTGVLSGCLICCAVPPQVFYSLLICYNVLLGSYVRQGHVFGSYSLA